MLGLERLPLYSKYVPILERVIDMNAYENLICQDGMSFAKLITLTAIGMMKVLGSLPKGKLHQNESFEAEVFNQIVLCAQKARPIDISNYKKTNVTMVVCMWIFPLKKDMSYTIFMHSYLMFISRIGMITITTEETNITHDGLEWNFKALHFN